MLIALEGCDLTGKTTLAEEILKVASDDATKAIIHFGPPKDKPIYEYGEVLQNYDPRYSHVVLDRFHWGDQVYGPLYRQDDPLRLTAEEFKWLELVMQAKGGITIHTTGIPALILERALERGEDYIRLTIDDISDIVKSFGEVMQRKDTVTYRGTFSFDPNAGGVNYTGEDIIALAEMRLPSAKRVASVTDEIIGDVTNCNALMVGESPSDHRLRLPFAPRPGSTGEFLFKSLRALGAGNIALANATKSDGSEEDLMSLWMMLEKPSVVALGSVAHLRLDALGIDHGWVQHPAFAKRMHPKRRPRYAAALGLAMLKTGDMRKVVTG